MPTVIKLPQLGESVSEGTIGRWLKQPGDRVERDEPLVEIQTDKVNAEVPSPVAGFLQQILLPEGTTAAVKTDMAIIGDEPVATPEEPSEQPAAQGPEGTNTHRAPAFTYDKNASGGVVGSKDDEAPAAPPAAPAAEGKRFYTPVVLRIAEEHGIDLATVQGSGAMGRVTRKDIERVIASSGQQAAPTDAGSSEVAAPDAQPYAKPAAAPPAADGATPMAAPGPAPGDEERPLSPMRRAIAEHMSRARTEIPDAWSMTEVDVTRLVQYRASVLDAFKQREGYELTYLPFFIKAVLAALRATPELNATWAGDHITVHREYHLGIAVSLDNGLVVPVLRNPDQLSIAGLAGALRTIVRKARGGRLGIDDLQGATFTVNNPGALGSIMSQPVVPVGQAGIVTMEAIVKRPIVTADDAIAVRSMMNCCLSFDHRILDGAQALMFLRTLKAELENVEYPVY
jgi:2-oxoisovalerate dehydrogenase E2 component (dihydrolipoyl transacylase)